jgi:hypothetical protein
VTAVNAFDLAGAAGEDAAATFGAQLGRVIASADAKRTCETCAAAAAGAGAGAPARTASLSRGLRRAPVLLAIVLAWHSAGVERAFLEAI